MSFGGSKAPAGKMVPKGKAAAKKKGKGKPFAKKAPATIASTLGGQMKDAY